MADRDALVQQTVTRLQEINSIDEFRSSQEEIIDLLEEIIRAAIDALKAFMESMFSLSEEEREAGAAMFQDEYYPLHTDIMNELERILEFPGGEDFDKELTAEMDKRLGSHMDEASEHIGKIMDSFMGGLMDGIAQGMTEIFGENETGEEEEREEMIEFDHNNPDTPRLLYSLYTARSIDELLEYKDDMIERARDDLQDDIWELDTFVDPDFIQTLMDEKQRVAEIKHCMSRIVPEMDKEFARLAAKPGAAEHAEKIKKELSDGIADKVREVNELLAKAVKILADQGIEI